MEVRAGGVVVLMTFTFDLCCSMVVTRFLVITTIRVGCDLGLSPKDEKQTLETP